MRLKEFITESVSGQDVLSYIQRTHHEPLTAQLSQAVLQQPKWELRPVPLQDLHIPDQGYDDDPEYEPAADPYDRVQDIDPEHAGEVSIHNVDRKPIVIDAKGYICAGQNVGDVDSREHLITRALIKGLKTHAKALKTRHTVNAIALLRNPKTVKEALASPEYSQWIAAIHAEMSSLIDKQTFEVCPTPHRQRWSH